MLKKSFVFMKRTVMSFLDGHCSMHAAGLTYYSMLAIVPLLCMALLVAKSFGAKEWLKHQVDAQFDSAISKIEQPDEEDLKVIAPVLGEAPPEVAEEKRKSAEEFVSQARGIKDGLLERIDSFDEKTLGWIGLALLAWSVLSSIGMIEVSFNEIWSGGCKRPFFKRMGVNLAVIVVLPLLSGLALTAPILKIAKDVIVATAGQTWLTKWVSDGFVWTIDLWVVRMAVALFFSSMAFGFIYYLVPAGKVRWKYAWRSGLVTAVLFMLWLKACAVAQVGIAKTSALYGSFAFLPIVLAWLYMSWQIVLFGCCINRTLHSGGAGGNAQ